MTSEVVLMNRRAIAMAADSATTVTRWVKGEQRQRYFKSTNKIFNLSTHHPVGLMIYGAGNLQGVPWDVVIKSYRDFAGDTSKDHLADFAHGLFNWICANKEAYPDEFREKQFLNEAIESAQRVVLPAVRQMVDEARDKSERREIFERTLNDTLPAVEADEFLANATQEDINTSKARLAARLVEEIKQVSFLQPAVGATGAERLADIAITAVYKVEYSALEKTGIVVGGFGQRDYFPSVELYDCYGNVLDKIIYRKQDGQSEQISQENVSVILPFARSEMIKTFIYGIGIDGLVKIDTFFLKALDELEDKLRSQALLSEDKLDDLKDEIRRSFNDEVSSYFATNHGKPLREVIGLLPVEDLAELAETLVLTESLKERVTTDEETVSGPIDVAVISKNDGFIWIKRKHYFSRELNPRYFAKLLTNARGSNGSEESSGDV